MKIMLAPLQGKGHSRMSEVTCVDFASGPDLIKPCSDSGDIPHACPQPGSQMNRMEAGGGQRSHIQNWCTLDSTPLHQLQHILTVLLHIDLINIGHIEAYVFIKSSG